MKRNNLLVSPLLLLLATLTHAAQPIAKAFPKLPVEPFSGAELIRSEALEATVSYDFILSSVEKIKRDLSIEKRVRTRGILERKTWELPSGVLLDEAIAYYQKAVGTQLHTAPLFECRARDCGRSDLWANGIFHESILYGPNSNQFYQASALSIAQQQYLLALYIVQRGNRRVYVHIDFLQPTEPVTVETPSIVVRELSRRGFAVIPNIRPNSNGELPPGAQQKLRALAAKLSIFQNESGYIICHLYGLEEPQILLEQSKHCAEQAATMLNQEQGLNIQAFGAGPLLPRELENQARLELVLPHRLGGG